MFEKIKKLFLADSITEEHLNAAIQRNWITELQKEEIMKAREEYAHV